MNNDTTTLHFITRYRTQDYSIKIAKKLITLIKGIKKLKQILSKFHLSIENIITRENSV